MSEDPTSAVPDSSSSTEAAQTPVVPPPSSWGPGGLEGYLDVSRATYTDEALKRAAVAAGWDASAVEIALRKVDDRAAVAPLRKRARQIVRYLYVGGFVLLTVGMLVNPAARTYGGNVIGPIVLFFSLLVAYGAGTSWLTRKGVSRTMSSADMFVLLSLPVVLWLVVAGLCVATQLPIPRAV